jgi:4-hydroxy-3-methylbut-2-enyl diphosphate reductase
MLHGRFLMTESKKPLTILLASPRGFCAGVDRALQIVARAIESYGRPVHLRHEIVHNRFVVESLEVKGVVFKLPRQLVA